LKHLILVCSSPLLFSCAGEKEEKREEEKQKRVFPQYHYILDSVLHTSEGIINGLELGQSEKLIPVYQLKNAAEKDKDHVTFEQQVDSLTRYSVNYSLENDTISEIEVLITSKSQDEGDRILSDLKNYYTAKYTAPLMDKGYFVFNCFDHRKKNFKITLTDNGDGVTSAIEMLVYREK
jgi:hypothetical protein